LEHVDSQGHQNPKCSDDGADDEAVEWGAAVLLFERGVGDFFLAVWGLLASSMSAWWVRGWSWLLTVR